MLAAAADHTSLYTEQVYYETEWTEDIPTGISWLNLLTAQPIPEETDVVEGPQSPERRHSGSSCSSASVESCYVVLEIQRPRSGDEASSKIDDEIEQNAEIEQAEEEIEEEEEIVEEVVEELNFAQTNHDNHNVHHDQLAISMTTEIPMEDYVIEQQQEEIVPVDNYAQVTETVILETPNDLLFQKAKTLSRFTKRMKAMSYLANKERQLSSSSDDDDDDESIRAIKHKPIRKVHEYHPTAALAAATNPQPCSPNGSTTSIDSIEEKTPPSDQIRVTTTFSSLSTKRVSNPVQNPRSGPTMGAATLTRTFAFDRACMEKYGQQTMEKKDEPIEIRIKSANKTEQIVSTPTDRLNCRSFTNTIETPFYIGSDRSTIDGSEIDQPVSTSSSIFKTNSHSKASSILSSMKKYAQTLKNEYYLSNHSSSFNEPTLLQVKYLDGRLPLQDDQARESFRQSQTISGSIASRLNRLHSNKMCSTQDLSQTTFHMSYRKRMLNRFRAFVENNMTDFSPPTSPPPSSSSSSQSRPWQHKTVTELFNERKSKSTRQH